MDWIRDNWHVLLGVLLAFGVLGLAATLICSPCWLSLVGLSALSDFVGETPYGFLTPTPTPISRPSRTPLAIGELADVGDGVKLGIVEYEEIDSGPYCEPSSGARLIALRIHAENTHTTAVSDLVTVYMEIVHSGYDVGDECWSMMCASEYGSGDKDHWYLHCAGEKLYPGTACDGWEMYEIPMGADPSELVVHLRSFGQEIGHWSLRP